jgi:hypothetical protein
MHKLPSEMKKKVKEERVPKYYMDNIKEKSVYEI